LKPEREREEHTDYHPVDFEMSSSTTAKRKPAPRLARPAARYWKGKAPKGVTEQPDSDEESENEVQDETGEQGDEAISGEQDFTHADGAEGDEDEDEDMAVGVAKRGLVKETKAMNISLKDVNIRDGKVIVAGREESGRTIVEQEEESEDESEEEEEEEGVKKEDEEVRNPTVLLVLSLTLTH
jgi:microfibrillar-associated protein 1